MATKTFKIGEYCLGGIITVETKGDKITIIGKEWDFSAGTKKSSNQNNAKEFTRLEVDVNENGGATGEMSRFLNELTTSYYSDEVMKWIGSKVKLTQLHW